MDLDLTSHSAGPIKKSSSRKDWGSVFCAILVLGVAIITGWFYWQKQTLQQENDVLRQSISRIEAQLGAEGSGQTLKKRAEIERILTAAQKYRTSWSEVMQAILFYETANIQFVNFSVGASGAINLQAKATNVGEVKTLINQLAGSDNISNPFVSSIIRSNSNEIFYPISFQLSFTLLS